MGEVAALLSDAERRPVQVALVWRDISLLKTYRSESGDHQFSRLDQLDQFQPGNSHQNKTDSVCGSLYFPPSLKIPTLASESM